jgi:hypothetical protein
MTGYVCGPCAYGKHDECNGLLRANHGFCACADRNHEDVSRQQRELNEAIYLKAVRNWFEKASLAADGR